MRKLILLFFRLRFWKAYAHYHSYLYLSIIFILLIGDKHGWMVYRDLIVLQLSLFLYGVFSLTLNDYCDKKMDLLVGEKRSLHEIPRVVIIAFILVVFSSCLIVSRILVKNTTYNLVLYAALATTIAYASPPLRLKTRRVAGFACGLLQEFIFPVLLLFTFYQYWGPDIVLFGAFYLTLALRSNLRHQLDHYYNDFIANVPSLVIGIGKQRTDKILKNLKSVKTVLTWILIIYFSIRIPLLIPFSLLLMVAHLIDGMTPIFRLPVFLESINERELTLLLAACAAITNIKLALLLPLVSAFEYRLLIYRLKQLKMWIRILQFPRKRLLLVRNYRLPESIDFKKILIIRVGALGDFILCEPTFRAIRNRFANSLMTLLTSRELADIAANLPYFDDIHIVEKDSELFDGWIDRCCKHDLVVNFAFGGFPNRVVHKSGLPYVIVDSFDYVNRRFHTAESLYRELSVLDLPHVELLPRINIKQAEIECADYFFRHNKLNPGEDLLVALHPGSGDPIKRWPPDNFAEVADYLVERHGAKIVFINGPRDGNIAWLVQRAMRSNSVFIEGYRILEVAAILRKCSFYLGNDSGIMHLCSAVGTHVLALFGPSHPQYWGPLGENHVVILKRSDCPLDCLISRCGKRRCLDFIKSEDVKHGVEEMMRILKTR